ncbi:E3 ubiquitin-protein ligase ATL23 [Malania oleifera]|uniref:E3 ubiquitin-protein ligase ATL23 n=1 Tax=Malania oleifera TaxID=397392 RepID=UPI0025AE97C0|nr:E3 ubiquitin-protein ligase ATL23 [Malania oleifera]
MLVPVFLALFLPCAGMSVVFVVYICLLWYSAGRTSGEPEFHPGAKPRNNKGLSESELEKLPKTTGSAVVMGTECAVCLDDIESDQPVRLIPGCNHGFHIKCADTWLSKHPVCPLCRTKLDPQILNVPPDGDQNPC